MDRRRGLLPARGLVEEDDRGHAARPLAEALGLPVHRYDPDDNEAVLETILKEHKGKSGIIYCLSRKKVEEIAQLLNVNGFKAAPYHAGLDPDVRMKNQDDFLNEETDIIVATIAFGMGIDKPDVRFVVHYDVPKSLEGYYQETGRSGRDGLEGICLMFYSHNDQKKIDKFNKHSEGLFIERVDNIASFSATKLSARQ